MPPYDKDEDEGEDEDNKEYFSDDFVVDDGVYEEEDKAYMPCCRKNGDLEYSYEDDDSDESKGMKC